VKRLLFRLASAKYLGLPSEQHYLKWVVEFLHVQFVMVFYRNQEVVIVGAGILLVKRTIYLNFVKVTMLVRSEKFRASKIMEARVRKTENITILMNHDTVEVLGDEQVVTGVKSIK
jgi:thioredoxin reductase (NADPH)